MTPEQRKTLDQLASRLLDAHNAGATERCHALPHHGSYSVAAHSWGVAMLLWYIWPERFHVLGVHALAHDVPELWTGDIPSPTIRSLGIEEKLGLVEEAVFRRLELPCYVTDLSPEDRQRLLFCDRLEFMLWAHDQQDLGNRRMEQCLHKVRQYLVASMADVPAPAGDFFQVLCERRNLYASPSFNIASLHKEPAA